MLVVTGGKQKIEPSIDTMTLADAHSKWKQTKKRIAKSYVMHPRGIPR